MDSGRTSKEQKLIDDLARRIVELRREAGMTPEDLARKAKLSRSYMRKVEAGQGNPSFLVLHDLAAALRVPVEDLLKK